MQTVMIYSTLIRLMVDEENLSVKCLKCIYNNNFTKFDD